ncbi:hypothetical protein D3C72_1964600 [compost metagenome]
MRFFRSFTIPANTKPVAAILKVNGRIPTKPRPTGISIEKNEKRQMTKRAILIFTSLFCTFFNSLATIKPTMTRMKIKEEKIDALLKKKRE